MRTFSRIAPIGFFLFSAACGGSVSTGNSGGAGDPGGSSTTPSATEVDIATLPGLSLWLQSTKGIVFDQEHTRVLGWKDQSASHNDLALQIGSGATRDGVWLGASPTVAFDAASAYKFPEGTPLNDWSGDFLIEIVVHAQYTKASGAQALFSCAGPQPAVPGATTASFYFSAGQTMECDVESDGFANGGATKAIDPAGYVVSFQRSGNVLTTRRNGAVDQTQTFDHVTTPRCTSSLFGAMDLEGKGSPSSFLGSDVAEVIVTKGATPDATVAALETSLMNRYQIGN